MKILEGYPDISKNKYALFGAVLISLLTSNWIIDNSGLPSDPDRWLEPARLLAILCIYFASFEFVLFLFDQALKLWDRFRNKQV